MYNSPYTIEEITKYIDAENVPQQHIELAGCIGVEAMLRLCDSYGGTTPYIPTLVAVNALVRKRYIQQEYNGDNVAALAKKHKVSTRRVQQMLNEPMPHLPR